MPARTRPKIKKTREREELPGYAMKDPANLAAQHGKIFKRVLELQKGRAKMASTRKIPPRRAAKPLSGAEHARYMKRAAAQRARTEKVVAGLMDRFGMKGTPKTMRAGELWEARMKFPVALSLTPAENKVLEEDHARFQNLKKIGLIERKP